MIQLYKQIGETPLEALKRLRRQRPEIENERLSYAGRLDPMAAGILPVLVGEENDRRERFLNRDKTYLFTVLFGVQTDTFDLLGVPELDTDFVKAAQDTNEFTVNGKNFLLTESRLKEVCEKLRETSTMKYPPYSSKTVMLAGKKVPLWKVARAGRLDEVTIPEKTIQIYDLCLQETKRLQKNYIIYYIINQIEKVDGDFRQGQIMEGWKNVFSNMDKGAKLPLAKFRLTCSAGTYVRRLAEQVGKQVNTATTTFAILRASISN